MSGSMLKIRISPEIHLDFLLAMAPEVHLEIYDNIFRINEIYGRGIWDMKICHNPV